MALACQDGAIGVALAAVKVWGLTGGIASGKSTTSRMFAALGARLIDADAVYHAIIQPKEGKPSPIAQAVANALGQDLLLADGTLDRGRLGKKVFADAAARRVLEGITHPAVAQGFQSTLAAWRSQNVAHAMYDVPLLYERGLEAGMDGVVVVWVPEAVQLARLQQRDGMDEAAARARLAAQMPLSEKKKRARWVIDNSGSREDTAARVAQVWREIEEA